MIVTFNIFSRASKATLTMRGSDDDNRLQSGGMHPFDTRKAICLLIPCIVALAAAVVVRSQLVPWQTKNGYTVLTPSGFLLYIILSIAQEADQGRYDVCVNYGLNLEPASSGDV